MERSLDTAYRRLVQRTQVPGFRKGKAPRAMLERQLGRHRLVHEALDILIPEAYNRAIEEQDVDAIDQPRIEVLQEEPVVFNATVPVRPTVELGDYRALRVERSAAMVDPKDVDAGLEELRHRYALHQPVDRPVRMGDIVRADVRGEVDGRQIFAEEDAEFRLREGAVVLLPGFAEGLAGAQKGEPAEVAVEVPPDYPAAGGALAGKRCVFTVLVREVKEEQLPALDDQFAREAGEGFPSLDALRQRLESDLRERIEREAEDAYQDQALAALAERAEKLEFPPVLGEREIDRLLRDEARAAGQDVDRYIESALGGRRPLEELRDELRPRASERVRRSLVLSRLAELEGILVEPAEIDAEVERIVGSSGGQAPQMRQLFGGAGGREAIERSLLTRKTLERLATIASDGASAAEGAAGVKVTNRPKKRSSKAGKEHSS